LIIKNTLPAYTVAEIHLDHLLCNLEQIRHRVAPADVMTVVKANAYGHGAVPVSRKLVQAGVKYLAVARVAEARELRQAGISQPILIFGRLFPDELEIAVRLDAAVTVTDERDLDLLSAVARRTGQTVNVHLNIDTGMGRVGVRYEQAVQLIHRLDGLPGVALKGIYTHFATADEKDKSFAYQQIERFRSVIGQSLAGLSERPLIHAANSGAILDLPEAGFDLVRAGIALYGHYPTTETTESIALKQVMTLKTKIGLLRRLPANTPISYGRRYYTTRETTIAVLPIGYADGIPRSFTNHGQVMIRGGLYPVAGTITMDQIMIDVGDDPVREGDDVIFWGDTADGRLQCTQVAAVIGTIPYELCCGVSARVPRIYVD